MVKEGLLFELDGKGPIRGGLGHFPSRGHILARAFHPQIWIRIMATCFSGALGSSDQTLGMREWHGQLWPLEDGPGPRGPAPSFTQLCLLCSVL